MYLCDDRLTPGQLTLPAPPRHASARGPRLAETLVNLTTHHMDARPTLCYSSHALHILVPVTSSVTHASRIPRLDGGARP